jgi:hypothetical protein
VGPVEILEGRPSCRLLYLGLPDDSAFLHVL